MHATAISTWFVADDAATATFFPQVGAMSSTREAQAVYWRCTVCFFASSLAVNANARHIFFTNTALPIIDGIELDVLFARWGIEVVTLPITYRLPKGSAERWGNQFYIFDVIDHLAAHPAAERTLVLDSDCLWLRPADALAQAIDAQGALTYDLTSDYGEDADINGLTTAGMARFARAHGAAADRLTPYHGGEIFAARQQLIEEFSRHVSSLWPDVMAQGNDAPREEAHLLSILYALEDIAPGTANPFIRRMWTTFRHHNLSPGDKYLTLWHLPAEKKTGFRDLFAQITSVMVDPRREPARMGLDPANYARVMGWPRRRPGKLMRDLGLKIREKIQL